MHKCPPNNQNFYNRYILYHCRGIQSHNYRLSHRSHSHLSKLVKFNRGPSVVPYSPIRSPKPLIFVHKGPPNNQNFYNCYILYHCHGIQSHSYRFSHRGHSHLSKVVKLNRGPSVVPYSPIRSPKQPIFMH